MCPSFHGCDLVHVNPLPASVSIEKVIIPFEKTLNSGTTYSFSLTGAKGSDFFIINEKSTDNPQKKDGALMWDPDMLKDPVAMEYKKGSYTATLTAQSGKLVIYVKEKGKENYIFLWKVI